MSGVLEKIGNLFSGDDGITGKLIDTAKEYFPPDMSEEAKVQMEMAMRERAHHMELEVQKQAFAIQQQFDRQVREMEGTASDLKSVPLVGQVILLLRGAQRPAVMYFTLYMDYMHFSGNPSWQWEDGTLTGQVFLILNALALLFLFGERAVKNVGPVLSQLKQIRKGV